MKKWKRVSNRQSVSSPTPAHLSRAFLADEHRQCTPGQAKQTVGSSWRCPHRWLCLTPHILSNETTPPALKKWCVSTASRCHQRCTLHLCVTQCMNTRLGNKPTRTRAEEVVLVHRLPLPLQVSSQRGPRHNHHACTQVPSRGRVQRRQVGERNPAGPACASLCLHKPQIHDSQAHPKRLQYTQHMPANKAPPPHLHCWGRPAPAGPAAAASAARPPSARRPGRPCYAAPPQ